MEQCAAPTEKAKRSMKRALTMRQQPLQCETLEKWMVHQKDIKGIYAPLQVY
jgi:hypothetical protein